MSLIKDAIDKAIIKPRPWIIQNGKLTEEQATILHNKSVFLGVPMYGGMCYGTFAGATIDLCLNFASLGMQWGRQFLYNESLIQRGRNSLTAIFERQNFDYLLFLDADISFEAHNVLEMILAAHYNKHKLIGASYPLKTINWNGVRAAILAGVPNEHLWHCAGQHVVRFCEGTTRIDDIFAPVPVKYLATGFMLIDASVLNDIRKSEWAYRFNQAMPGISMGETVYAYFDCKIDERGEYLSEDYLFSARCNDIGLTPQLCPWIHLQHSGTITYDGCLPCSSGQYAHNIIPKKDTK